MTHRTPTLAELQSLMEKILSFDYDHAFLKTEK